MDFDEQTNSLIVSFREAGSNKDFSTLRAYAYQPTMFDITTSADFVREIAKSGVSIVEQQIKEEQISANTGLVDDIRATVGNVQEFVVADLYAQP